MRTAWLGGLAAVAMTTAAGADDLVERGRYLVDTIAGCGNCHTPIGPNGPDTSRYLAGDFVIDMAPFRAVAPNITPDPETAIGTWS